MFTLPKAFLDEVRARVPLSDVIGKRVKLTRAGREFKGCCPFHHEKTPSFYVNDQKGFYHCFGCGAHGDVIRFLTDHDNMGFMDAVEQLAGQAGLQVPRPSVEDQKKFQRQMSLYDLMEAASKFYEQQLHRGENKKILEYLLTRGLSLETIKSFRLGYAPEGDGLLQYLKKLNYTTESIIEAGLYKASERKRGEVYSFFRARVMFPVTDLQGRVVAFGGRVLPESYGGPPGKSAPKYINSPETAIFHKGRNLYALSRARKAIGDGETVIVVEGYMDVIALAQAGFRAAVAPLGTALTETQVEELWRVMPEDGRSPVLCFDGDAAGQRAAGRALARILPILRPDHSARFAFLPSQHDPDSLIKDEGTAAMQRVIDAAIGLFDMLWQEEVKNRNLSQPEAKAGLRANLIKAARQIPDQTVQEFYIHQINQKINDVFLSNNSNQRGGGFNRQGPFKGGKFKQQPGLNTPYRPFGLKVEPPSRSNVQKEKTLLAIMLNYPELFDEFGEDLGMFKIPNPQYDDLRQEMVRLLAHPESWLGEEGEISLDDQVLKQHLSDLGYGKILDGVFDDALYLHAGFARPGGDIALVRQGWQDTWERCQQLRRRQEPGA